MNETKQLSPRDTTAAQLSRDLVRMAATIATYRGVTIAEVLDPIIREPLTALSAEVGEEMRAAALRPVEAR